MIPSSYSRNLASYLDKERSKSTGKIKKYDTINDKKIIMD
jgi:hypothetical protein